MKKFTYQEYIEYQKEISKKEEKERKEEEEYWRYIYREKIGEEKTRELIEKLKEGESMKLAVERMLDKEYAKRDRKSRQEGRREGRKEETLALAKKMLKEKIDINVIMKITGLKKEQIM